MSKAEKTVAEIVRTAKLMLAAVVILSFLLLAGAVMAYSTPTHTYTNDHFTVANSTDGEQVVVTYEVNFEKHGDMDDADRKQAMDNMKIAQSCANERLDAYIESHNASEVRGGNLAEITADCGNEYISIERVQTTEDLSQ